VVEPQTGGEFDTAGIDPLKLRHLTPEQLQVIHDLVNARVLALSDYRCATSAMFAAAVSLDFNAIDSAQTKIQKAHERERAYSLAIRCALDCFAKSRYAGKAVAVATGG
jgi:hypothetical protein